MRYPISVSEDDPGIRTHKTHMQDVKEILKKQHNSRTNLKRRQKTVHCRGVKGPTEINFPLFDCVWGFPIDYMHGMILGVERQIWDALITAENLYHLNRSQREEVDTCLLSKAPHKIYRTLIIMRPKKMESSRMENMDPLL